MTIKEIRLLTVDELAKFISYSPVTLRTWRREGRGPKWLKLGSHVYYKEADVIEWMEGQSKGGQQ